MKSKKTKQLRTTSKTRQLVSTVRQTVFPKEFRIGAITLSPDSMEILEELSQPPTPDPVVAPAPSENGAARKEYFRFLADIGTGLWRMRRSMIKPGTSQPPEEMRRVYRHLESTWDVLTKTGVEIVDHTNTPYVPGMSLTVITFELTPGIRREMVTETVKPTIYFKGQPIQIGEVIVGTPESAEQEQSNH